ncbi:uncharacterized protein LOC110924432 [Helianthus annuus]|uniref:uncharacterized protein LOC110924432 n=1 Tax=Helianthus annuus TaxID=4232 RepID=UPI000B8F1181|nr:uncharacterized protein LOC110924432 [Helianthus annuus]
MGLSLESMFWGVPGSENNISFWKERWLFEDPLCDKFPALFQLERHKNAAVKDRLGVDSESLELNFMWSGQPSTSTEISELHELSEALTNYDCGLDLELAFEWNNWSPKKVNFLIWRLVQDKLPTYTALARRNVVVQDTRCKMCGDEVETAIHLFASCSVAEQIWEFVSRWCRIHHVFALELKDLASIHKRNRGSQRWKKVVNLVTQAAIWVIWRSRNDAVFEGK